MTPGGRGCCVPGCNDTTSKKVHIPVKTNVRNIWLSRINNPGISDRSKSARICVGHFHEKCFYGGELRNFSLPTLNLPGGDLEPTEANCFLFPESPSGSKTIFTPEKVRKSLARGLGGAAGEVGASDEDESPQPKVRKTETQRVYRGARVRLAYEEAPSDLAATTSDAQSVDTWGPSTSRQVLEPTPVAPRVRASSTRKQVGTRVGEEERVLRKQLSGLRRQLKLCKSSQHSQRLKMRLINKNPELLGCFKNLSAATQLFIKSQIRNQPLQARGRRFSLEDKVFALSLMKQSGRGYRYLQRMFSLPSARTLRSVLQRMPLTCGINSRVFDHLKVTVAKLDALDKFCVMMFDEVAIQPGLTYDRRTDSVLGFVDLGGEHKAAAFADHALVFMLKGIRRKWKQPVSFYFTKGTVSSADLTRIIKSVVRNVRRTGLEVVASICDQGTTNVAAVNNLLRSTEADCLRRGIVNTFQGYIIDNEEVVHLYDVPHLMKGVRNSLLNKDLHFTQDGQAKVASWSHILNAYLVDSKLGPFSSFLKLTDEHVVPNRVKKMSVRHCTQVFSQRVASAIKVRALHSAELPPNSQFYIDPKASETGDLLLFFDKLFDSVNGSQLRPQKGKILRCAVSSSSSHLSFWRSAILILESMYFTPPSSTQKTKIPSLSNWVFTLRGFSYLWSRLKARGFRYMMPRAFNQDPLENFFSCVRGYAGPNSKPTCSSFISTVKSLLINNLVSSRSVGANCEADETVGYLDTLKSFVEVEEDLAEAPRVPTPIFASHASIADEARDLDFATAYVAGAIGKKIRKQLPKCHECLKIHETKEKLPQNTLIVLRNYGLKTLVQPSTQFTQFVRDTARILLNRLPYMVVKYKLKEQLLNLDEIPSPLALFCPSHADNVPTFMNIVLNVVIYYYLLVINRILKGQDLRRVNDDPLTKLAFVKSEKSRKRK